MFNHFVENILPLTLLFVWVLLLTSYVVFCIRLKGKEKEKENEVINKNVISYGTSNDFIYIKL